MKRFAAIALLMVLVGMGLTGCYPSKDDSIINRRCGGYLLLQVILLTPTDTLRSMPGDTVSVAGYAIAKEQGSDYGVEGTRLDLELSDPDAGWFEFTDSHRDTTNSLGQVSFVLRHRVADQRVTNTIRARHGSAFGEYTIWFEPTIVFDDQIHLGLSRRHLTLQDSVQVWFTIIDTSGVGIFGVTIPFAATGGYFSPDPFPPTDISGRTVGHWYPTAYGWFIISAPWSNFNLRDSVFVDSTLGLR
ncbi:MAG TPA: hypothetical protein VGL38_05035 [bacterium]|jgi:hypothetical protein